VFACESVNRDFMCLCFSNFFVIIFGGEYISNKHANKTVKIVVDRRFFMVVVIWRCDKYEKW
jgi:hypothetical protein